MSLYYESSRFLEPPVNSGQSLKTQVFGATGLKSKPAQIYVLVLETAKWSAVLSQVVEKTGILKLERKLSPSLSLLLVHDLLLSKSGVSAPKEHVLRLAIERHKARLNAEFTRCRLSAGFASLPAWRAAIDAEVDNGSRDKLAEGWRHPRWIRVNTLKTSLDKELSSAFAQFEDVQHLQQVLQSPSQEKVIVLDKHVPDLVAVPSGIDLSKLPAYLNGRIIFQDKASCFPASLLDPQVTDGDIIDACAAPGNKTTHLAALIASCRKTGETQPDQRHETKLFACERDPARSATLKKMTATAAASVHCLPKQDFLKLEPNDPRFINVGAILLDPSCSGSGIVGRDDADGASSINHRLVLPRSPAQMQSDAGAKSASKSKNSKKRKQNPAISEPPSPQTSKAEPEESQERPPTATDVDENIQVQAQNPLPQRLASLSAFQLALLKHAFRFPRVRKVAYSTCSIYGEENEHVVLRALDSSIARERGWRVARRDEQVPGMKAWSVRGDRGIIEDFLREHDQALLGAQNAKDIAEACLRCEKGSEEGTMGFFAVLFVRDETDRSESINGSDEANAEGGLEEEEEWQGLSDSD